MVLTSPQGRALNQQLVDEFAAAPAVVIICGHYAGVDERIRTGLITHEVSIGDYVLTGGELAAMVIIDAVSRFVPDVVGSEENVREDSITSGLLQHPLYTRPAEFRGMDAPAILRSGNHAEIERVAPPTIPGAHPETPARPAGNRPANQLRPHLPGRPGLARR